MAALSIPTNTMPEVEHVQAVHVGVLSSDHALRLSPSYELAEVVQMLSTPAPFVGLVDLWGNPVYIKPAMVTAIEKRRTPRVLED